MTVDGTDWKARFAQSVAEQVRRLRLDAGLSVQRVADLCTEKYGVPMKRSVLANFEGGRRPALSVVELIALARILEVPPVQLLFPVGRKPTMEAFPGEAVDTWLALKWFTGEQAYVPHEPDSNLLELQAIRDVDLFRKHDAAAGAVRGARGTILALLPSIPGEGSEDPPHSMNPQFVEQLTESLRRAENDLLVIRRDIRDRKLIPPEIPYDLAYLKAREEKR